MIGIQVGASVQPRIIHRYADNIVAPERAGEAGATIDLLRDCAGRGRTVFLFGRDSATIHALRHRIASALPTLRIAGVCDADFAGPIDRAILDHIAAAHADVIVSDLSDARFRLFCAQCSAAGIYGKRINRPGSFADIAFGAGRRVVGRLWSGRLFRATSAVGAALRFARIILTQVLRRRAPSCGTAGGRVASSGRPGRG